MSAELFVGLMSGTSLDGIDAVLARFDTSNVILANHFSPLPSALRAELKSLLQPGPDELNRCAEAAMVLSRCYAQSIAKLLDRAAISSDEVTAIGCHGQTVRHNPQRGFTVQLCNGALLAELTGIQVVCDFRSRDVAAAGQGAPLVPAFHARFFAHPARSRVIVNIGGVANLTFLPKDAGVIGFDCGPGNALLDEWVGQSLGLGYDADGAWAAQGHVIPALLAALASNSFFVEPPPKSTGRELFNLDWVRPHLAPDYAAADVQTTLSELTALSIADAIHAFCPGIEEVYLCGGGASNRDLVRRLASRLGPLAVETTAALGLDPDWVEAGAFAWLARETLAGRPGNLPAVTGAKGSRVLGCIYPA